MNQQKYTTHRVRVLKFDEPFPNTKDEIENIKSDNKELGRIREASIQSLKDKPESIKWIANNEKYITNVHSNQRTNSEESTKILNSTHRLKMRDDEIIKERIKNLEAANKKSIIKDPARETRKSPRIRNKHKHQRKEMKEEPIDLRLRPSVTSSMTVSWADQPSNMNEMIMKYLDETSNSNGDAKSSNETPVKSAKRVQISSDVITASNESPYSKTKFSYKHRRKNLALSTFVFTKRKKKRSSDANVIDLEKFKRTVSDDSTSTPKTREGWNKSKLIKTCSRNVSPSRKRRRKSNFNIKFQPRRSDSPLNKKKSRRCRRLRSDVFGFRRSLRSVDQLAYFMENETPDYPKEYQHKTVSFPSRPKVHIEITRIPSCVTCPGSKNSTVPNTFMTGIKNLLGAFIPKCCRSAPKLTKTNEKEQQVYCRIKKNPKETKTRKIQKDDNQYGSTVYHMNESGDHVPCTATDRDKERYKKRHKPLWLKISRKFLCKLKSISKTKGYSTTDASSPKRQTTSRSCLVRSCFVFLAAIVSVPYVIILTFMWIITYPCYSKRQKVNKMIQAWYHSWQRLLTKATGSDPQLTKDPRSKEYTVAYADNLNCLQPVFIDHNPVPFVNKYLDCENVPCVGSAQTVKIIKFPADKSKKICIQSPCCDTPCFEPIPLENTDCEKCYDIEPVCPCLECDPEEDYEYELYDPGCDFGDCKPCFMEDDGCRVIIDECICCGKRKSQCECSEENKMIGEDLRNNETTKAKTKKSNVTCQCNAKKYKVVVQNVSPTIQKKFKVVSNKPESQHYEKKHLQLAKCECPHHKSKSMFENPFHKKKSLEKKVSGKGNQLKSFNKKHQHLTKCECPHHKNKYQSVAKSYSHKRILLSKCECHRKKSHNKCICRKRRSHHRCECPRKKRSKWELPKFILQIKKPFLKKIKLLKSKCPKQIEQLASNSKSKLLKKKSPTISPYYDRKSLSKCECHKKRSRNKCECHKFLSKCKCHGKRRRSRGSSSVLRVLSKCKCSSAKSSFRPKRRSIHTVTIQQRYKHNRCQCPPSVSPCGLIQSCKYLSGALQIIFLPFQIAKCIIEKKTNRKCQISKVCPDRLVKGVQSFATDVSQTVSHCYSQTTFGQTVNCNVSEIRHRGVNPIKKKKKDKKKSKKKKKKKCLPVMKKKKRCCNKIWRICDLYVDFERRLWEGGQECQKVVPERKEGSPNRLALLLQSFMNCCRMGMYGLAACIWMPLFLACCLFTRFLCVFIA